MSTEPVTVTISGATIYDAAGIVTDGKFSFSGFTCYDGTVLFDQVDISGTESVDTWTPTTKNNSNVNVVINAATNKNFYNGTEAVPLVYYNVTASETGAISVQSAGPTYIVGGIYSNNISTGSTGTGGAAFRCRGTTADVFVIMAKTEIIDGQKVKTGTLIHGNTMTTGMGGAIHTFQTGTKWYIDGATFSSNAAGIVHETASYGGGAISQQAAPYLLVQNGFFYDNYAANAGGAISMMNTNNTTAVYNNIFAGNSADLRGGAINVYRGILISEKNTWQENSSVNGAAIYVDAQDTNAVTVAGDKFIRNTAAADGGALYVCKSIAVTDSIFSGNTATVNGGAISVYNGTLTSQNNTYNSNEADSGAAIYVNVDTGTRLVSVQDKFIDNTADTNGGALFVRKSSSIDRAVFTGNTAAVNAGGAIYTSAVITVTASEFSYNCSYKYGGAVYFSSGTGSEITDCRFTGNTAYDDRGGALSLAAGTTVTVKDSVFTANVAHNKNGGAVRITGTMIIENSQFFNNQAKGRLNSSFGTGGAVCIDNNGDSTITNSYFSGNSAKNNGGAISITAAGGVANISGCTFATASDTIYNAGTLTFSGNITLNANLSGTGTFTIADGANFTIGKGVDLNGVNFSNATITVDGADYLTDTLIATGVGGADTLNVTNNKFMTLTLDGTELWLKEIAGDTITENSYIGDGLNIMDNGKVDTFFATQSDQSDIATKISGGKVEQNLVGGAYVSAGNSATVNSVELLIGGTAEVAAKVYAGGYLYGNAGDAEAAAEAQLKVTAVNINIDGGAVSTNMYGGVHARQFGNAKVDTVNITVTDGSHSRIYAGGWAEKGAVSSVGTSNVIISGGTVDYLYGGGANADGTTTVGTTTITIENDAVVNTIFMSGRYGYSSVSDTVTLNYNSTTGMKRLSGVSSAGVDNAENTVVNVLSDLTADLIDYVDKFVISENCTLTANDAFYLGDRNNETGATEDFTTFDFIAEGEANWTAIAGISDFTNAKFSVNGIEGSEWKDNVMTIGDYTLTYDEDKKTITLANA